MSESHNHQSSEQDEFPVGSIVPLSRIDIPHTDDVGNAAEASIASTLRNRKSHCTACGGKDGGVPLAKRAFLQMIQMSYPLILRIRRIGLWKSVLKQEESKCSKKQEMDAMP